jgi:DUF4097 and DUF4098 domain-containing protein YvlB
MKKHPSYIPAQSSALKATLALSLLVCLSASAVTEEQINKHFTVQPGGKVVVDVDMGSITVSTNAGNEVVVDVWRKIGRGKKADEEAYLRDHPVQISQEGNSVTVRSRSKSKISWSLSLSGRNQNQAKYTISVPAQFNAQLHTSGGPISISDLTGEVKADTSGGGLQFARLHGPLDGHTSGGGIDMTGCEGKLKIDTSGGGIKVAGGSGPLDGHTSGGSVSVKQFRGPAHLDTSGGGITLEDVAGEIEAHTSGGGIKAALPSPLSGPVKLDTSAGGITLHLPADAAFNLDADTSAGSVSSELPVTAIGKREHSRLKGAANGGGQPIVLHSSAGSIHILKSERRLAEESK